MHYIYKFEYLKNNLSIHVKQNNVFLFSMSSFLFWYLSNYRLKLLQGQQTVKLKISFDTDRHAATGSHPFVNYADYRTITSGIEIHKKGMKE